LLYISISYDTKTENRYPYQKNLAQGLLISKSWHNAGEALCTLSELEVVGPADLAKNHDDEYRHPET
jgi:hypothetical protein